MTARPTLEVFVADEQSDHAVDLARWRALIAAVLAEERLPGPVEVSLLFVGEAEIAQLNERFLGRAGPTDVLAFPIDDQPEPGGRSPDTGGPGPGWSVDDLESPPMLLGDVIVCPAVAARQAGEHGVTLEDEIALLVVHGLLHLRGYDHEVDADAEVMEARERDLLARHHHRSAHAPADPAPEAEGTSGERSG